MATGTSLAFIAIGAVLALAVNVTVTGLNVHTVGIILMVVGVIGLLYSMLFIASFAPFSRRETRDSMTYHDDSRL